MIIGIASTPRIERADNNLFADWRSYWPEGGDYLEMNHVSASDGERVISNPDTRHHDVGVPGSNNPGPSPDAPLSGAPGANPASASAPPPPAPNDLTVDHAPSGTGRKNKKPFGSAVRGAGFQPNDPNWDIMVPHSRPDSLHGPDAPLAGPSGGDAGNPGPRKMTNPSRFHGLRKSVVLPGENLPFSTHGGPQRTRPPKGKKTTKAKESWE